MSFFLFFLFLGDDNHNTNRYRIAGVYAPANGEFSTRLFSMPNDGVDSLYINVDAHWHGYIVTGGCDEGCAAYVMVELQDENNDVIPGFERNKCTLMNVRFLFISTEIQYLRVVAFGGLAFFGGVSWSVGEVRVCVCVCIYVRMCMCVCVRVCVCTARSTFQCMLRCAIAISPCIEGGRSRGWVKVGRGASSPCSRDVGKASGVLP